MKLYCHPVSSYSQKALTAMYEKEAKFDLEVVDLFSEKARAEYAEKVNTFGKVPTLVMDDGWKVPESSIIIEYIDRHVKTGTKLIPDDPDLARQTRFHDRMFDIYANEPMQILFFDPKKPKDQQSPAFQARAKATLDKFYPLLDKVMENKTWAMGDDFTMADCAAAPALGYLRMVYPYDKYKNVVSYMGRLAERPSYARVMKEAAPYLAKLGG